MKKLILFSLLLTSAIAAKCQLPNQGGYTGVYKWTEAAVIMQRCNGKGIISAIDSTTALSIVGSKFTVYNVVNGWVVIKMYDYTTRPAYINDYKINKSGDTTRLSGGRKLFKVKDLFYEYNFKGDPTAYNNLSPLESNTRNYGQNQIYFKIPLSIFTQKSEKITKISGSLALGAINFPFKYRFAPGEKTDFSGSFNIGAAAGYKFPHDSVNKWTCTIPIAIGISNINIDSAAATHNQTLLKSTNNFSALSLAGGIILENNKVQIGVFLGFDKISRMNNVEYGWIYQNKPWFSIGFGYSLFSSEKPSTSGSTDTQQTQ